MQGFVKLGAVLGALIAVLIGTLVLVTPPAEAQTQTWPTVQSDNHARLHMVLANEDCPATFTLIGATGDDNGTKWCTPNGFAIPVDTSAGCDAVKADLGIGIYIDPICASFGFAMGAGDTCLAPGVQTQHNGGTVCLGPVYSFGTGGLVHYAQPVCVEDPLVQDNAALAGLRVGERFTTDDGRHYEITTGVAACSFNCEMGYDINCDGVLGDYCAVEFNLQTVRGVGQCLAAMTASASAVAAAPAAPSNQAQSTLAHTGPHDMLPPVALWLLGIGATTLAAGRHARTRRQA